DQGISALTTAANAAQSAVSVLQQLQGLLNTAKTQTASQRASTTTEYNTLSQQLNRLLNDASYQGLDLVNSSTSTLSLQFSNSTASVLKITGQNLLYSVSVTKHNKASVAATQIASAAFSAISNHTSAFDAAFQHLQAAINTVQSAAASIGGNVTFLQT